MKVEELDKELEGEYGRQERAKQAFLDAQEELSAAQEEIDMDPLPEGAQPVKRIQRCSYAYIRSKQSYTTDYLLLL